MVITVPEPIKQYSSRVTPQTIVEFAPIVTPFSKYVLEYFLLVGYSDLGLITFVKTALGPIKTSSDTTIPS